MTETKPGYKQTKLGWIPEAWDDLYLKDVADVTSGGTPSRKEKGYWGGNIPWVTTSLIDFNLIESSEEYITKSGLDNSSAKLFSVGTILMALYGQGKTRGKVGVLGIEATTNQACAAIQIRSRDVVDVNFLFAFLQGNYDRIRSFSNTGNQENLNGNLVKHIFIPLPPLPEQKAIAACLGTWDKAIGTISQLIAQKEQLKKGLMQQLLSGKKRLPGFSGEWSKVPLQKLFSEITEKNDGDNHEPLTISARLGFVSQRQKFDRVIAGDSLENYTLLKKGDFSYNKGNSNLYEMGCIYKLEDYESAVVPFVYISFRPAGDIDSTFYKHYFINHGLDRQLKRIISSGARGDGLLNVNKKNFFSLLVPFPPKEEQSAVASVCEAAEKEINLLKEKLEQLKQQKKGLMQQLLTGKKRLPF